MRSNAEYIIQGGHLYEKKKLWVSVLQFYRYLHWLLWCFQTEARLWSNCCEKGDIKEYVEDIGTVSVRSKGSKHRRQRINSEGKCGNRPEGEKGGTAPEHG